MIDFYAEAVIASPWLNGRISPLGSPEARASASLDIARGLVDARYAFIATQDGNLSDDAIWVVDRFARAILHAPSAMEGQPASRGTHPIGSLVIDQAVAMQRARARWIAISEQEPDATIVVNRVSVVTADPDETRMRWRGPFLAGTEYAVNDVVEQEGWLMVARAETTDPASPQKVGDEIRPIEPTIFWFPRSVMSAQISYGQRFILQENGGYLLGVTLRLEQGMTYRPFLVFDPNGTPEWIALPEVLGTAASPTWIEVPVTPRILLPGLTFDFLVVVHGTAAGTSTWNGNWDYTKPNNEDDPLPGQLVHPGRNNGTLRIHKFDDALVDRSADFALLTIGSTVALGASVWTINQYVDEGDFLIFEVTPASQDGALGVVNVVFEYDVAANIDYGDVPTKWNGNTEVRGLFGSGVFDVVEGDTAFPCGTVLQEAVISDDWEFMAASDVASGSGGVTQSQLDMKKAATNGFIDRAESTISFDDGTRTFSITPTGDEFDYFADSTRRTKSAVDTVVIDDTPGAHWIHYIGDVLTSTMNPIDALFTEYALVCIVFWNSTAATHVALLDARHGNDMAGDTKLYNQRTFGVRYGEGLSLENLDVDGSGNDASAAQIAVAGGVIWNEDIRVDIADGAPQTLSPIAEIPMFHRLGAGDGEWYSVPATQYPVVTTGSGRAAFSEFTGGSWQLTEVGTNDFTFTHLLATGDINTPIIGLVGTGSYNTKNEAEEAARLELLGFGFGTLDGTVAELLNHSTLIWQTASSYSNAVKSRLVSTDTGDDYVSWLGSRIASTATASVPVWGGISGTLSDQTDLQAALDAKANSAGLGALAALDTVDTPEIDVQAVQEAQLGNKAVTNAKLASVNTSTIKGRITAALGDPEDLTAAQARTVLNVEDGARPNTRYQFSDFHSISSTNNSPFLMQAIGGGTQSATPPAAALQVGTHGIALLRSSTSANSGYVVRGYRDRTIGQADLFFRSILAVPDDFTAKTLRTGFSDSASAVTDPVDGAYFELIGSSTISANCQSNNSKTTHGTTFTMVVGTYYDLEIYWTSTSSVNFKIRSLDRATTHLDVDITTNIPTGTSRAFGAGTWATSSATAVDDLLWLDYQGVGFLNLI